jgi:hypothetical protein
MESLPCWKLLETVKKSFNNQGGSLMIWYLIICGLDSYKSDCTFSPAFNSKEQCEFVQRTIQANTHDERHSFCVGVRK